MLEHVASNINTYLTFSAILFCFGLIAALTRRNAIGIFMGIELMLNAAGINFVAFQAFRQEVGSGAWLHGHVFSLIIIVLAAIEAAVALAIVLRVFALRENIDPYRSTELRG